MVLLYFLDNIKTLYKITVYLFHQVLENITFGSSNVCFPVKPVFLTMSTLLAIMLKLWEMGGQVTELILAPVILFTGGHNSACVRTSQMGGNVDFEIDESRLICSHHVLDNEALSTSYIHQAKKNGQLKQIDHLQSKL